MRGEGGVLLPAYLGRPPGKEDAKATFAGQLFSCSLIILRSDAIVSRFTTVVTLGTLAKLEMILDL